MKPLTHLSLARMRPARRALCGAGIALLLCTAAARAAEPGELGPRPALEAIGPGGEALGACPLRHTQVSAELSGFVARTRVTQVFENPFADPIEAVYTFPLPEDGAVNAMRIRIGEREILGQIERREEARRIYDEARAAGQLAALLDEERPNVFTQSLANLQPGESVEVEIEYVAPLPYRAGAFEFHFPTVVGPRFVPGASIGRSGTGREPDTATVPDASRITPPVAPAGQRAGHDVSLEIEIDAGVPIDRIDSPLHAIDVTRDGERRASVRLREGRALPDRDFALRVEVAGDALRSGALVHRGERGEGYLSVLLVPPRRVEPARLAPRELIFVIDRSGSQRGRPLEMAKRALREMLERMRPADTFQIVSFSSGVEQLFERPEAPTPANLERARRHVDRMRANGGTFMGPAVERVCAQPADENRLRIVSFMTDGYVGNDFEVLSLVKRLRGRSRWFPFGTGNSVNRYLIEQMAQLGGGEAEVVLLDASADAVAARFAERIAEPVLTDVRVEFEGLDVVQVEPSAPSDLWAERPLLVHARYRRPGSGRIVLRGFRGGEPYEQVLDVELPERESRDAAIASMWARARVRSLLEQDLQGLQSGHVQAPLREAVVELALEHQLLTPFTSFVAVDRDGSRAEGPVRTVAVPVELPQGVSREGALGRGFGAGASAARLRSAPAPATSAPAIGPGEALRSERVRSAVQPRPAEPVLEDASAASPPTEEREKEEYDRTLRFDHRLLHKLGPRLQSELRSGALPSAALDERGRLRVAVRLAAGARPGSETLEALGLEIESQREDVWIGWLRPADLERLARSGLVERIEIER